MKAAVTTSDIADSVSLSPALFSWRDLAIDILIYRHGIVHVLDEEEVPADLAPELRGSIRSSRDPVLFSGQQLVRGTEGLFRVLRPAG